MHNLDNYEAADGASLNNAKYYLWCVKNPNEEGNTSIRIQINSNNVRFTCWPVTHTEDKPQMIIFPTSPVTFFAILQDLAAAAIKQADTIPFSKSIDATTMRGGKRVTTALEYGKDDAGVFYLSLEDKERNLKYRSNFGTDQWTTISSNGVQMSVPESSRFMLNGWLAIVPSILKLNMDKQHIPEKLLHERRKEYKKQFESGNHRASYGSNNATTETKGEY